MRINPFVNNLIGLRAFGQSAEMRIIRTLEELPPHRVKDKLVYVLHEIGTKESVPILREIILHEENDTYTRRTAIQALTKIAPNDAVNPLVLVLKSSTDDELRRWAANFLGRTNTEAVHGLLNALSDVPYVKDAVIRSLGKLGDKNAVPHLLAALTDHRNILRDKYGARMGVPYVTIAGSAAHALMNFSSEARAHLIQMRESNPQQLDRIYNQFPWEWIDQWRGKNYLQIVGELNNLLQ
ncbi:MAG: HEAT repeat domain-containing protein [Anaerolineae bacterium]